MSYTSSRLVPGETIVYKAPVAKVAYVGAAISFLVLQQFAGIFKIASTELALTDKRIIGKTGIFRKKTLALKHADVEIVKVSQNPLGMLLGYGSIIISGSDGSRVRFKWIKHPYVFQDQANEAIEIAVLGRRLSDIENPPAYETAQSITILSPEPALPSPVAPAPFKETPTPRTRVPVDPDKW